MTFYNTYLNQIWTYVKRSFPMATTGQHLLDLKQICYRIKMELHAYLLFNCQLTILRVRTN